MVHLGVEGNLEVERAELGSVAQRAGRVRNQSPGGGDDRHMCGQQRVAEALDLAASSGHEVEVDCRVLVGPHAGQKLDEHMRDRREDLAVVVVAEQGRAVVVDAPRSVEERRGRGRVLEWKVGPELSGLEVLLLSREVRRSP